MENASKALIIAGSVLIALMIIGALLLMFSNLSNYQSTNTQGTREAQVIEFNNQYETYNRKDVRGSELYSLLNRVIDYNRRQSTAGTGSTDQGQYISYEPMIVEFTIKNDIRTQLSIDGTYRLIKKSKYTSSNTNNEFENEIKEEIDRLENKYGTESLTNLTTNITRIFPESPTPQQEQEAVERFNNACKNKQIDSWDDIKEGSQIRNDIYKYYEYVQFKRAYFDCTKAEYNKNTGRIVKMTFETNGKLN